MNTLYLPLDGGVGLEDEEHGGVGGDEGVRQLGPAEPRHQHHTILPNNINFIC